MKYKKKKKVSCEELLKKRYLRGRFYDLFPVIKHKLMKPLLTVILKLQNNILNPSKLC